MTRAALAVAAHSANDIPPAPMSQTAKRVASAYSARSRRR